VFIEAKDDGGGGDNWSYKSCKAPSLIIKEGQPACRKTGCWFVDGDDLTDKIQETQRKVSKTCCTTDDDDNDES